MTMNFVFVKGRFGSELLISAIGLRHEKAKICCMFVCFCVAANWQAMIPSQRHGHSKQSNSWYASMNRYDTPGLVLYQIDRFPYLADMKISATNLQAIFVAHRLRCSVVVTTWPELRVALQ